MAMSTYGDPCTICWMRGATFRRSLSSKQLATYGRRARRFGILRYVIRPLSYACSTPSALDLNLVARGAWLRREANSAVNATVDGQTTAHYVIDLLAGLPVKLSVAHAVPVGDSIISTMARLPTPEDSVLVLLRHKCWLKFGVLETV